MTQTYTPSGVSLHLPQQGFPRLLQSPRKVMKNMNRNHKLQKYCWFCCQKSSVSTESFSSNYNKPIRDRNLLEQTFDATTLRDSEFLSKPNDEHKSTLQSELGRKWDAFYRFCRLYSVIGTIIGVTSVSLLPLTSLKELSPAFFVGYLKAVIPLAFVNIYVAGINQLVDVDIDKINKPYLPVASGEFTMGQAKAIVWAFGLTCMAMGIMFQSAPLLTGLLVYFLLGTAYSVELPLLRWKTNPFLAALCMVGASGLTIQLAVFFHIQKYVLGKPLVFTKSLGFAVIFFSLFAVVLAMFKDIPDVDGDKEFGNQTFSVRHGKQKVFSLCITILLIAYGSAAVIGASSSHLLGKLVSVLGHCTLASILWFRANSLNIDDNSSVQSFYMFLWKLFNAEYVLIHFIS